MIVAQPRNYWEGDPLGVIRYPEGVKFVTASFKDNFGTATGAKVRAWCQYWKWALVWFLDNGNELIDPRRLVDPLVAVRTQPVFFIRFCGLV